MTTATHLDTKPYYEHDCDACKFLGHLHLSSTNEDLDLYYCNQNDSSATVIGRQSSEPSEYISGLMVVKYQIKELLATGVSLEEALNSYQEENSNQAIFILIKATQRAFQAGLITEDYFQ